VRKKRRGKLLHVERLLSRSHTNHPDKRKKGRSRYYLSKGRGRSPSSVVRAVLGGKKDCVIIEKKKGKNYLRAGRLPFLATRNSAGILLLLCNGKGEKGEGTLLVLEGITRSSSEKEADRGKEAANVIPGEKERAPSTARGNLFSQ